MLDAPLSSFAKVLKRDDCSAELTHFLFVTDSEPPAVALFFDGGKLCDRRSFIE